MHMMFLNPRMRFDFVFSLVDTRDVIMVTAAVTTQEIVNITLLPLVTTDKCVLIKIRAGHMLQ